MTVVPPRLHAFLARESATALLFARVRTNLCCTLGWDRQSDEFQVGQWLRARIYPLRSDLSPDGKHFVYFVFDGRRIARGESEAYTAVSRAPYLKALAFFPETSTWCGGGLFLDDRTLWANGGDMLGATIGPPSTMRVVFEPPAPAVEGWEDPRVYFRRLARDGWEAGLRVEITPKHHAELFEKPLRDLWVLKKAFHASISHRLPGKGVYYEEHALIAPDGSVEEHPEWQWADFDPDRGRLVWASGGCLFAGQLEPQGLGEPRLLLDSRSLKFERRVAPY